jgi:hypothetical protein
MAQRAVILGAAGMTSGRLAGALPPVSAPGLGGLATRRKTTVHETYL